jgi:hypothetical protein
MSRSPVVISENRIATDMTQVKQRDSRELYHQVLAASDRMFTAIADQNSILFAAVLVCRLLNSFNNWDWWPLPRLCVFC